MIFTYHSVDIDPNIPFCVSEKKFLADMEFLRKYKVCSLADYKPHDHKQVVITFDDGYKNIMDYAVPILKEFGYPFEVFLVEKYTMAAQAGKMPRYLNFSDLEKIKLAGGYLQYHTKTHKKLTELPLESLAAEIIVSPQMKDLDPDGFNFFAYPYNLNTPEAVGLVARYYQGAVAGQRGCDDNPYLLKRITVNEDEKLSSAILKFKINKFKSRLTKFLKLKSKNE